MSRMDMTNFIYKMLDQKEQLLILIKSYNFKMYIINKFSRDHNVCSTTVRKYLKEFNVEYNNKKIFNFNRSENGQFTFKNDKFTFKNDKFTLKNYKFSYTKSLDNNNVKGKNNQKCYIKSDLTSEETVKNY